MNIPLREKLQKDIVFLDGGFGTYAQSIGLKASHFGDRPGCMEYLSFTSPDLISRIHRDYLNAGSDAIETNTFGGNALKLEEYGLSDKVYEINLEATKLARLAADEFAGPSQPRYVIGTMGPTGKLPSSSDASLGNISYGELKKIYFDQAVAIIDGGADALLAETAQDLLEMKAAVSGAREAVNKRGKDLVIMAQCTLANNGRMLLGTEISAVMATLGYLKVDVIGINCSTGPVEMEGSLRFLSDNCSTFISCMPNAGMPVEKDGKTLYPLGPDEMAELMARFVKKYRLDMIGGCCGTTPEHIRCMRGRVHGAKKRTLRVNSYCSSFYAGFDLKEMARPVKVGERINTQGSRKMKELLKAEDYDGIVELGKEQQSEGANILDICSVLTERSTEEKDAIILTKRLSESIKVPVMIDSTSTDVIRHALENYPGTAFINSVNLEDGGKKARDIFALAAEHGSFVVALTIDEKGMAKTVESKLEIAERLHKIATEEYGLEPHRLIFDLLTFTLGTGEKEYADSAILTCKALKLLKKKLPGVLTVLGVSNVSFGLTKEGRKILNMALVSNALKAGLDMAIVNPSEFIEYTDIPGKERSIANDLLLNKREDALDRFVEYFSNKPSEQAKIDEQETVDLPIEEKLEKCVINRNKTIIIPLIDEALQTYPPEHIVNNILMNSMKKVGDKLESGEMVLPYVLQSAEVMRKAIEYLETFLSKELSTRRGKILLATVFGDVHDIGKNLVKMILENNGFDVIDLGKQVPVEKIVEEAKKNKVDAVGLSALLVSTARHMKSCVESMHEAGLDFPVLIGGAPTNERFAREISEAADGSVYMGGVFYAKDAFTGLSIMQALTDSSRKKEVMEKYHGQFTGMDEKTDTVPTASIRKKKPVISGIPQPPFFGIRPLSNISADEVFSCLDKNMLFNLAWGARIKDKKEKERMIKKEYEPLLEELKEESIRRGWLDLKAVYGYFRCRVSGRNMEILNDSQNVIEAFEFTNPNGGINLADYFSDNPEKPDIIAFQAVTIGSKVNDAIEMLNDSKEVTRAFFLHGLSVHLAEALAEYVHGKVREELKLKKGQGKRYSPGYPMWKDLKDQVKIFKLLELEKRLSVQLTEEYQMVPEQSTTAMIVHNSEATY